MPKITVEIEIDIQNYDEIVRTKAGMLGGLFGKMPYGKSMVRKKVDNEVTRQIKSGLEAELGKNLIDSLREKGVKANVDVKS